MDQSTLIQNFGRQLAEGFGALFIGAGLSKPSRVPDWLHLIKPLAKDYLGLEINESDDLAEIAQFIVNRCSGNRGPIVGHFQRELQRSFTPNVAHSAIAHMNVSTVWTTNYDNLLEEAFRADHLRVKSFSNDDSISRRTADFDVEVVKMHGSVDISPQAELVITQQDYDDFFINRPATAERLRNDLLTKSFLFLGYSYRDTDIRNVLIQAGRLSSDAPRQHFLIAGKADTTDKQLRQQLWAENLKRVGIECILLDSFKGFDSLLRRIAQASRGSTVFVTGSHTESSSKLATELGNRLANEDDISMIDGQSEGISRFAISAFMEAGVHKKKDIHKRLKIFPNPYAANESFESDDSLIPMLKLWRAPLMRATHVLIVFSGKRGTQAEIQLAKELDCRILPVPTHKGDHASSLVEEQDPALSPEYKTKALELTLTADDIIRETKLLMGLSS